MKKKHVVSSVSVLVAVGLTVVAMLGCQQGDARVTVINKSSFQITEGQVQVGAQSRKFYGLDLGAQTELRFGVGGDSHYEVFVDFGTNQIQEKNLGYLTRGMSFNDTLVVTDQGILLNPSE